VAGWRWSGGYGLRGVKCQLFLPEGASQIHMDHTGQEVKDFVIPREFLKSCSHCKVWIPFPTLYEAKTGQCHEPLGNLGKNPIDAIASVRITASQPRFAGDTSPKTCSSRRWLEPLPLSRSTRSSTIGYRAQTSLPISRLAHNLWGWSRAELQVWSELQPPPASRLAGKSNINGWIELPASLWSATFVAQESPDGSSILSFQSAQPEHPFLTMHLFVETELSGSSEGRDRTCRRSKGPANYHMGGCKTGFRSFRSSRGDPETHNTCCCVLP